VSRQPAAECSRLRDRKHGWMRISLVGNPQRIKMRKQLLGGCQRRCHSWARCCPTIGKARLANLPATTIISVLDNRGRSRRDGRGCSSGVEHNLAKVGVVGSNPIARSRFSQENQKGHSGPWGRLWLTPAYDSPNCKLSVSCRKVGVGFHSAVSAARRFFHPTIRLTADAHGAAIVDAES
jgi:hypothetical protein